MIETYFKFRRFEKFNIGFIRAETDTARSINLWKIPPGARRPEIAKIVPPYEMSKEVARPFLLGSERSSFDEICPPVSLEHIFANFLKGNPSAN
ncbi:MAG: hypothetical protein LC734_01015 [Acidobacteria bacterium]|nr:hypothetical protein [Acidobacteriota bacterium]